MERVVVPVSVPKGMLPYIENEDKGLTFEQSAMLLYPLIHDCIISHGRAAEILGVPKWNLIDFYDKIGLPYLNQTVEDLEEEIAGFDRLREKRAV